MLAKMNFKKYFVIMISIIMLSGISVSGYAQPAQHEGRKGPSRTSVRATKKPPIIQHKHFTDSRYQHNRSYLNRGHVVRSLPRDHRIVIHHNDRYYHSHGIWYRHHGGRYLVVSPPVGLFIPFLPFAYTTIWIRGIPYYYANETYYTQTPGGYVVVEPPPGEVNENPPDTEDDETVDITDDKMFVYPSKGQRQAQQDQDRYECHKWAVEQAGYDPTKPLSEMSEDEITQQRKDYRRAMTACLDSRGYSVK